MKTDERLACRFAGFLVRHPYLVLFLVVGTCVPALLGTMRLKLRTDWTELLPENKRSILDLRRIQERVGGTGTFTVFIEGDDLRAMERLADAIALGATRLPADLVRHVDKDVREERAFFEKNRYLYADTKDLEVVRDRLKERIAEEKSRAALDLGLDDDEGGEPPSRTEAFDLRQIKEKYDAKVASYDKFPGGYYVGEQGHALLLFIRTASSSSNIAATNRLEGEVRRLVAAANPAGYHPSLRVSYTGDVLTARAEHEAIRKELLLVSILSISLILGSIYFFYFELRAIFVLGASLLVALLWTFGLTYLHIGYLSTTTAFLASIVAGNGINSGLILIARYLEERRRGERPPEAVAIAMHTTWAATLTASAAAALSYGALLLTDFRGFSQFGFIGGIGLLLTWIANYTVVPTLLALTERKKLHGTAGRQRRGSYGRPFLFVAERAPYAAVGGAVLLAVVGVGLGSRWLRSDPFEYDFRRLRNERSVMAGPGKLQSRVNEILKGRPRDGMIVLADRPDQVPLIREELLRVRDTRTRAGAPPPIGDVRSIESVVPPGQPEKIVLLGEIRELALQALPRLDPQARAELEPLVPPAAIAEVRLDDVPPVLKRAFTEKDGRVGLMLHVEPAPGVSIWDGRGLLHFAAAVREIALPTGEVVHASGRSVIFADMLDAILQDGPRLTLASFVATLLLILVAFRRPAHIAVVLAALLVGMCWMLGLMALAGIKLNFLNFIAIPITFGIGVDYAVNMTRRYAQDGWGSTRAVLLETGGAVILCSLTTVWGYLSLLISDNQAMRSFGKLAVLGEITCLVAAVVVLPSIANAVVRRRARLVAASAAPVQG